MGVLIVVSFKDYSTKIMKNGFSFFSISLVDEKLYDPKTTKAKNNEKI